MTSITDINLDDVKLFLKENNITIPNTKEKIYDVAKNVIINGKVDYYPDTIVDWIIAYNFLLSDKDVKTSSREEVYQLSDEELSGLADKLGLDIVNEDSILPKKNKRDKEKNLFEFY